MIKFCFFGLYAATINGLVALFLVLRAPSDTSISIVNIIVSAVLLYFYFGFPYVVFNDILKLNKTKKKRNILWLLWLTAGIISSLLILTIANKEVGLKIFTIVNIIIFTTIAYYINKHKIAGHNKEKIFK